MIKCEKSTNKLVPVVALLCICCIGLLLYAQQQNRDLAEYREVNYKLEQTAYKAIADLADSNEHIRAYELRITQLEEELAYYQ
ncbi:hypothetical protein [Dielma fastidiosa]|uniref:hypothetical protein n=1 Tax=Dielma fastidiosa TaxID=1034346 RepID=UPI0023F0DBC7|nr:hypothetical protein [Dielma fastidiosa]